MNAADATFFRILRHGGISKEVTQALMERTAGGGGGGGLPVTSTLAVANLAPVAGGNLAGAVADQQGDLFTYDPVTGFVNVSVDCYVSMVLALTVAGSGPGTDSSVLFTDDVMPQWGPTFHAGADGRGQINGAGAWRFPAGDNLQFAFNTDVPGLDLTTGPRQLFVFGYPIETFAG